MTKLEEIARAMKEEFIMARYYIDCEFDGHNGPLISMGIVRTALDSITIIVHGVVPSDPWVRDNVMPILHKDRAGQTAFCLPNMVGPTISEFIDGDPQPIIIADSPVDIGRFCAALSTGSDGGWASADYERMTFVVENVDCYPTTLAGAVQHNAWWDAMALRHRLTTPTPSKESRCE